jgi:hypothetical protein
MVSSERLSHAILVAAPIAHERPKFCIPLIFLLSSSYLALIFLLSNNPSPGSVRWFNVYTSIFTAEPRRKLRNPCISPRNNTPRSCFMLSTLSFKLFAHKAQAINYREAYGVPHGLLINFGGRSLEFKRVYGRSRNGQSGVASTHGSSES